MSEDILHDLFGVNDPPHHDAHVLLFYGFDRSAAGLWHADVARCPFCAPREGMIEPCVTSEEVWNGPHTIHFIVCGGCGTRGPWASTESEAIARWEARA